MKRILYIIFAIVFTNSLLAQGEPNDCVNSIIVCGNGVFESTGSGIGNSQEVSGCGGFEHNSIWLKINVVQSGTLGFDLIPLNTSINEDYDFWVYAPNAVCGILGSPIRCCTSNPTQSSSTNNHTGMFASTLSTTSNYNGASYVRWLDVVAGQSYYICIDRPVGDDGFQLQWTGSATSGTGAFTVPPTANTIADVKTCSSVLNIGVFDLANVISVINNDTINNTVNFFDTIAEATDNIPGTEILLNAYFNYANPQTVYARVTNNITGCYSITSFNLVVNQEPTASITVSSNSICSGDNVTITFSGTPNATIEYTKNNGTTISGTLNASGQLILTESPTASTTYKLLNVYSLYTSAEFTGTRQCIKAINQSEIVAVNLLLTPSITGSTTICSGSTATLTINGTPNSIVDYSIDTITSATPITLNNLGVGTITTPSLTLNSTYTLTSVSFPTNPSCTKTINVSTTIAINSVPFASITGTTTICTGGSATITFGGTPNAIITYNVNNGTNQLINLDVTGNATIPNTALTSTITYNLVSVTSSDIPSCTKTYTGISAIITVQSSLTASISGATTVCSGATTLITFTGTPNATVTYTLNNGSNQTIILNNLGVASITPSPTITSTYALVNVSLSGSTCTQSLTQSVTVNIISPPTASIVATNSICNGSTASVTLSGTPNAVVTYNINGGTNQNLTINASGSNTITTLGLTTDTTYNLISVSITNGITCTKNLTDFATINVTSIPTVITTPTTQTICSGQSALVNLTSNLSTTTYSWTVTQTGVTGAIAGNGNLINQIVTATGATSGTVIYTITPISNNCLGTPKTVTITVKPNPIVTAIPVSSSICSGLNATINLSSNITNTTYSWVFTATNVVGAGNGTGNIINQNLTTLGTSSGYVVYTITPTINSCPGTPVDVTINVSPKPNVTATTAQSAICSGNSCSIQLSSTDTTTTYSWTATQNGVSGANSGTGAIISQNLIATGSTIGSVTYTILPNNNGCFGNSSTITINVIPAPTASATGPTNVCTGYTTEIILNASLPNTTYSWTATQIDATGASSGNGNEINQNLTATSLVAGTVNYSITPFTNGCPGTTFNYEIKVHPKPIAFIEDETICIDANTHLATQPYTFFTGLDSTIYDFEWYLNSVIISSQTNNSLTINQGGIYGLIVTNSITGCTSLIDTAIITESLPGESLSYVQTEMFADEPTLVISVFGGNGTYTYQLDDGTAQYSNILTNVPAGEHLITVRDANECTYLTATANLIGYPRYLTPNGDGYHDTWNIIGIKGNENWKISVFDRYGKFLSQFSSSSSGWDGNLNGQQLPSNDYWFTIDYTENGIQKKFKSHFALKR